MCNQPSWLPPLEKISSYDGDVSRYIDALYALYTADFINNTPYYKGKPVYTINKLRDDGREEAFWNILQGHDPHAITDDLGRFERICWPRRIIDAADSEDVLSWCRRTGSSSRRGEMRPHLALRDFNYIVVLIQRKTHFKLFTAFPVEREARRLKYRKEYEASEGPEKHDAASKDGM